ncbi:MAG: imidazolonepropionase [Lachnospiraceae bacterium]|nr:imidazolonepropionase [Lachnospiraceae bacterium]
MNRGICVFNIGMLATPEGKGARRGAAQGEIRIRRDAWVAADADGVIRAVGTGEIPEEYSAEGITRIDAGGRLVTPGLIDAHTHLIFGGWREHELALKLKGVAYLDILAQGGGILSTVRNTRAATEEELTEKAALALDRMLQMGTTTCEAKSGYGLAKEEELKQLRAIQALQGRQSVELVPTFLGAHALPEEYKEDREAYLCLLTEEMIPAVAEEHLAEFCDVFCETGVFTVEESRTILEAGQKYGLKSKIHADEIDPLGGSQLAGEIGAVSAEHLICSPDEGIESMAKGGTVAVCLPATSFYLDKSFARARDMISAGVPVAVATDFNPGSCPCLSLQLAMNLACFKYRLTPEEVLTAVTLNAAAAICRADTLGSLEAGKQADLVIWDAENLDFLYYRFGDNLVKTVIKKGKVCVER